VRQALRHAQRLVVIERALAVGVGGAVSADIRTALGTRPIPIYQVVAGLGGRPITQASLRRVFENAAVGAVEPLTFLDLDAEVVQARSTG